MGGLQGGLTHFGLSSVRKCTLLKLFSNNNNYDKFRRCARLLKVFAWALKSESWLVYVSMLVVKYEVFEPTNELCKVSGWGATDPKLWVTSPGADPGYLVSGVKFEFVRGGGVDLINLPYFSQNSPWLWNNLESKGGSSEPPQDPPLLTSSVRTW